MLIVNCYVDETRRPVARRHKIPQTLGPVFLAGGFDRDRCEVRLYNELAHGPLEDARLLAWPELLVLTGLTTALDRMRQVTAYARTASPGVAVAVGGHAARAFPAFCRTFADYVCLGDVEEVRDVADAVLGSGHAAAEMTPRFDLADWISWLGYAESSRYCNFGCSFCTLTGEGRSFRQTPVADLERQLAALGRRKMVTLLDNNFYGNDRRGFLARLECMGRAHARGAFDGWAALVTNDFFFRPDNLEAARAAGCVALFTGVESFDAAWNRAQNKLQNSRLPQVEIIRSCLDAGVVFLYGMMLDVTSRPLAELRRELDFVVGCPDITLPAYVSIPIPIPGTPFFYDCLDRDLILPRTKVRDLDATTISLRPLGPLAEAAEFARDLQSMRGYRARVVRHSTAFVRRYRKRLSPEQLAIALTSAALIAAPLLATVPTRLGRRAGRRTHVSSTEALDGFYRPAFPVDPAHAAAFRPAMLTDERGRIAAELAADVEAARPRPRRADLRNALRAAGA